jgi:hypothetical protein
VRDIEASTVATLPGRSRFWQNEPKRRRKMEMFGSGAEASDFLAGENRDYIRA